jgi:esterase
MKLFFREFGYGDPVVILHGIFGISDNWVTIGKRIAEKFRVLIPDQRNHGRSPHSPVFNYAALQEDLREFLEEQGIGSCILIGHSMGGKVAMHYALEYPGTVEKLIVADISPKTYFPRQTHIQMVNTMLEVDFNDVITRKEVEEFLELRIKDIRIRHFILKNLYYVHKDRLGWRLNAEAISNNLENIFSSVPASGEFNKPSLFVRGGNSDYILDEDNEMIMSLFPQAQVVTIPGAGHWLHADQPDLLCRTFSSFLEKECTYQAEQP